MSKGKSIELFLVDGVADGLVTAELSNWSGRAIKIPRNDVMNCTRKDTEDAGVYFLFCEDDDSVYIGEAENVIERLRQHIRDYLAGKELYYWNNAVFFTGRDLNKALIRYLENRLFEEAKECRKYKVLTKNTYKNTIMKESQIATMEEFIENIKILINSLGYKVLTPVPKATNQTTYLYIQKRGANAKGFVSTNGFTILKNSKINKDTVPSFPTSSASLKNQLISDGIIVNDEFTEDYEFKSPSAAASIVLGCSANGNSEWKSDSGKMLKDL